GGSVAEGVFTDAYVRGTSLIMFVTVPASLGYILLAGPIGDIVAVGRMGSGDGPVMVAASLAGVAAGLVGESSFFFSTQASYARGDVRTPLRAMGVQALVSLAAYCVALGFSGLAALIALGAAFSI